MGPAEAQALFDEARARRRDYLSLIEAERNSDSPDSLRIQTLMRQAEAALVDARKWADYIEHLPITR